MHNLNLAFYMMIGWLQMHMAAVVVVLVLLVALYGVLLASGRGLFHGAAFGRGIVVALVAWGIAAALLPGLTGSAWSHVAYSTDYIMLALMSAGFAGVAFLLAYPAFALMRNKA